MVNKNQKVVHVLLRQINQLDKEISNFGSIISVVGKSTMEIMEPFWVYTKSPIWPIMKSDETIIRKTHMEQFDFITNLLGIKDPNITILDYVDKKSSLNWIIQLLNATAVMVRWLNMTSRKNLKSLI